MKSLKMVVRLTSSYRRDCLNASLHSKFWRDCDVCSLRRQEDGDVVPSPSLLEAVWTTRVLNWLCMPNMQRHNVRQVILFTCSKIQDGLREPAIRCIEGYEGALSNTREKEEQFKRKHRYRYQRRWTATFTSLLSCFASSADTDEASTVGRRRHDFERQRGF